MKFEMTLTDDQERFRAEVQEWLEAHIPDIMRRPARGREQAVKRYQASREFGRLLGQRGWLYPSAPKEYGGGGLGLVDTLILEQETQRHDVKLPPYYDAGGRIGSATMRVFGTDEQKRKFLPPIYAGEVATWQLLSEPGAGSDLAGVTTTAARQADGSYVINGEKQFIGSPHHPERFWIVTRTDRDASRHENLGWFMMDANLPGISTGPQRLLSDLQEDHSDCGFKNWIHFDNVHVPADALIGGHNNGWQVARTHLGVTHGAAGTVRRNPLWGKLLAACTEDRPDGTRLVDDPDVRNLLGEVYSRMEVMRLYGVRNFWMNQSGTKQTYEGPQYRLMEKTTGLWLTRAAQDILGPSVLISDPDLGGALGGSAEIQQRQGVVMVHAGGTSDVLKLVIARHLGVDREKKKREQS